jgi:Zn-dependent protease with chaperone function
MSEILRGDYPELAGIEEGLAPELVKNYRVFHWMILIAIYCLMSGVAVFVIALLSVLCSLASQAAQYWSLSIGWHILRLFALTQVVAQGALGVALSYWVTAFWFESISIKLIAIVAICTVVAAGTLVLTIFRKLNSIHPIDGRAIDTAQQDPLMRHLRELATSLGTKCPAQIVAGIDSNFFVTEQPVTAGTQRLEGSTLFISLSLLRILSRSEANAVFAHEMAHFSGSDTLYSKKISPLLRRYEAYLSALRVGPVFSFMLFFWSLYQWSLNKLSRAREFRADGIAAGATSPADLAGALLKIEAYSSYRAKVEDEMFGVDRIQESMKISDQVATEKEVDIAFETIKSCSTKESLGRHYLTINYRQDDKNANRTFCISGFGAPVPQVLETFNRYYGRHQISRKYHESKKAAG